MKPMPLARRAMTPMPYLDGRDINDSIVAVLLLRFRMSSALHVRNVDDDLVARLKRRAARHGRSAEAEHREILRQALSGEADTSFADLAAEMRALTAKRRQTPSEILLRESRDKR